MESASHPLLGINHVDNLKILHVIIKMASVAQRMESKHNFELERSGHPPSNL